MRGANYISALASRWGIDCGVIDDGDEDVIILILIIHHYEDAHDYYIAGMNEAFDASLDDVFELTNLAEIHAMTPLFSRPSKFDEFERKITRLLHYRNGRERTPF